MAGYLIAPLHARFILASASERRCQLLEQAGVQVAEVIPADIDETPEKKELPRDYALRMAQQKAAVVSARHRTAFVLAADTVVACGRRILPKAETDDEVACCLDRLSGRQHSVYGAFCLVSPSGSMAVRQTQSRVTFRRLVRADKQALIRSRDGIGKAGGYAIQGRSALYIRKISGSYSNIVGLDIYQLSSLLLAAGFYYG